MKSKNDAAERRLVDRLRFDRKKSGEVIRILATTHDLDADFFEHDFLATVLGIANAEDHSYSGRVELQRRLATCEDSAVLVEATAYRSRPSLRTTVLPVSLRGPRLHAKLVVLECEHEIRVLLGSANLTANGYRFNREVAGSLAVRPDDTKEAGALIQALDGAMRHLGHLEVARSFVDGLRTVRARVVEWSGEDTTVPAASGLGAVWSSDEGRLLDAVLDAWPRGRQVDRIRVASPFWAEDGTAMTPLRGLTKALIERDCLAPACRVELLMDARRLADGSCVPSYPSGFGIRYDDLPGVEVVVRTVSPKVDKNDADFEAELTAARVLHAKVAVLEGAGYALAYAGSANFTRRGWGFAARSNIEAGWLVEAAPAEMDALLPPTTGEPVTVPSGSRMGGPEAELEEPAPFWPHYVTRVVLEPSQDDGESLVLSVAWTDDAPGFAVTTVPGEDGETTALAQGGASEDVTAAILTPALLNRLLIDRHVLVVEAETDRSAAYPVNVAPGEARLRLPLAPGAARPGESALLAYYQGKLTFEELYPEHGAGGGADAHAGPIAVRQSGVDTSRIQSYQVREFVDALPGLRAELVGTVGPRALMEQAFMGSVSPVALARLIHEQVKAGARSPTAAAFQLVELKVVLGDLASSDRATESLVFAEVAGRASERVCAVLETIRASYPDALNASSAFSTYEIAMGGDA